MNPPAKTVPSRPRLLLGGFVFITGFAAPALIPFINGSDLPAGWKTFLSGFLAIGIPEIFMLIAAGILGKEGFAYLKSKLWRMIAPPETVSRVRYRIGLLMFLVPIVFIWLQPYLEQAQPNLVTARTNLGLLSVSLLAVSLFVLGGEFWDKLRGLFLYRAVAIQPDDQVAVLRAAAATDAVPPISRLLLGGMFFGLSLFLPIFIPLLSYLPVNGAMRVVIAGLMVFGIPQFLMLLAVAVLGKPGFTYLKQRLGGLFRGLLADRVSQRRHRLGVVLLAAPFSVGLGWPYLTNLFGSLDRYVYHIAITGDVFLVAALLILGGGFWEKLVSLFRHRGRIEIMPAAADGEDE